MSLLLLFGGNARVSVIGPIRLQAEYSLAHILAGEQVTDAMMIGESNLEQILQSRHSLNTDLQGESADSINLAGQV